MAISGLDSKTLGIEAPKNKPKPDFYVAPDGKTYTSTQYGPRVAEDFVQGLPNTGIGATVKNYPKQGNFKTAINDLNTLPLVASPQYVGKNKDILRGELADGTGIIARPYSSSKSDFAPTLEFQFPKVPDTFRPEVKVRYFE